MRIGVFLRSAGEGLQGDRKRNVLQAFHQGLLAEGADGFLVEGPSYEPCDIAVIFGGQPSPGRAAVRTARSDILSGHKGRFIFVETPFLGRQVHQRSLLVGYVRKWLKLGRNWYSDSYGHYRVGVDGFFQDDGDFNNRGCPPDRWTLLSGELGLTLKPYRVDGRHVLLVGQNPGDTSLRGLDMFAWLEETARHIRERTGRPILIRPHPVTRAKPMAEFGRRFKGLPGIELDYPPRGTIEARLRDCWVMVAYSSGAAIDALLQGVPAITLNSANMAWPVADHSLDAIEAPTLFEREPWLHDLAYAQWSPEEMRSGAAWRHLSPALKRASQPGMTPGRQLVPASA